MGNKVFIATDGSNSSLPDEVQKHVSEMFRSNDRSSEKVVLGLELEHSALELSSGSELLNRWDIQSHQYSQSTHIDASFLSGLFSGKGNLEKFGVVQEAKRYRTDKLKNGREVEFGTAVRLAAALEAQDFEVALTIPNIAAKAQLSNARARISLSVVGYTGSLGKFLPAPDDLDVENLSVYLEAFKSIQAEVFSEDRMNHISPTSLGYYDVDES